MGNLCFANKITHPPAEDLVDGRRFLERALGHDLWAHLLHVEHEGVQGLLDVRPVVGGGALLLLLLLLSAAGVQDGAAAGGGGGRGGGGHRGQAGGGGGG